MEENSGNRGAKKVFLLCDEVSACEILKSVEKWPCFVLWHPAGAGLCRLWAVPVHEGSVISCTERRQHSQFPVSVVGHWECPKARQHRTAPASNHRVMGKTVEGDSGQKEENAFFLLPLLIMWCSLLLVWWKCIRSALWFMCLTGTAPLQKKIQRPCTAQEFISPHCQGLC